MLLIKYKKLPIFFFQCKCGAEVFVFVFYYGLWRRKWQPTPVSLPGESHGRRSLIGYSLRGRKESDTTEWLFTLLYCGHPTPELLPGKSHGQRSLVGCSPWGRWESDTTERLHFHFLLSCIGEENGNPLQCSCLENPRDGGAWWAAAYEVAQSRTRLKRLSSSSSSSSSMISFASFNLSFKQTFPNSPKWSIAQICTFYSQF